jgi:hypothetical protein
MDKVMATYRDGTVILDSPVDWPDGTRIEVAQVAARDGNGSPTAAPAVRQELLDALSDPERIGLDESLWPRTPQEIELLVEHMDRAEPLQWSPEELSAMDAQRQNEKERQKELTRASWCDVERLFE